MSNSTPRPAKSGIETRRSTARLIAILVAIVVVAYLVSDALLRDLNISARIDLLIQAAVLGLCAGTALWFVVVTPLRRIAAAERTEVLRREQAMSADAARQEFVSQVSRAMDMAGTEAMAYSAATRALTLGLPRLSAELLMADSSDAHLKRSAETGPDGAGPGCTVASPRDCPAIRRAQTLLFASASRIDTCPYLIDRSGGDLAAGCIPVSVAGRAIGVLHATAPVEQPPDAQEVYRLETLATHVGTRIGMLRVMEATHLQAATDPLTGLLNRRSFENRVHDLLRHDTPMAIAMADLDHFKQLNDTHGHSAGDRAIRLFARTMRSALRNNDLICRYGGEEFVIALPDLGIEKATRALYRVQENLALALSSGTVPPFTASFGVVTSYPGANLEELVRTADGALFRAKRAGRNRIVAEGPDTDFRGDTAANKANVLVN